MWKAQGDGRLFGGLVVCLALLAWAALAFTRANGISAFSHQSLSHAQIDLSTQVAERAGLFLAGWLVMTVAMMLPTTLPLVVLFGSLTRRRGNRTLLLTFLLAGYAAVWLLFGAFAYVSDFGIHRVVESDAWLHTNSWLLLALPLLTAGIYQFTPLKYMCLDKCRSPYSFIVEQWRGGSASIESLRLGWQHGLFCLGCCWSLMLLMFAVSAGNLAWMLVLAIVMSVEKNLPWGRRISAPLGVVLLSAGSTIFVMNALAGV